VTSAEHRDALRELWLGFVRDDARDYSPLYAAIGTAVAHDDDVLDLIADAPPSSHLPIALLAAVHYVVLGEPSSELARIYAGERPAAQAAPLFLDLVHERRDEIAHLLATRRIQTNEIGRTCALALGLAAAEAALGPIDLLVDAGTSAGMNLRYDAYHLDYGSLGSLGDPTSSVRVESTVTGLDRLPATTPTATRRVGIDRSPIDLTDDDQAWWLLACVWPDTGRLPRTQAAIDAARQDPPNLAIGDLVDPLASLSADDLAGDDAIVVMSSLAVAYVDAEQRAQMLDNLRAAAQDRPVAWVSLEPIGTAPLEAGEPPVDLGTTPGVLALTIAKTGESTLLAWAHPHGGAIHWTA
jgi:hypothetical protein